MKTIHWYFLFACLLGLISIEKESSASGVFVEGKPFYGLGFKINVGPRVKVLKRDSWHFSNYNFLLEKHLFLNVQSGYFRGLSENDIQPPTGQINGIPYKCVTGNDVKGRLQNKCILHINTPKSKFLKIRYLSSEEDFVKNVIFSIKRSNVVETIHIPPGLPETPLHGAALTNNIEKAKELISEGVDINSISGNKFTPLHYAVIMGHDEMVELLVSSGADINSRGHPNSNQGTPIRRICSDKNKNYEKILKYLINNGAKLGIKSSDGSSPIVQAAGLCPLPIFKILLDHGADPFEKDFYGNSLLHIAVQILPNEPNFKDKLPIIKILLKKGLSINSENSEGITPLDLIKANKDKELEDLVNKLTKM